MHKKNNRIKESFMVMKSFCKKGINKVYDVVTYKKYAEQKIGELEAKLRYLMEHSDISKLKPEEGYIRKKQLDLVDFSLDFFEKIAELNLKPFMIAGNLLGQFRNGGFVPWDDDLDFGLIRKEYQVLFEYAKSHYHVVDFEGIALNKQREWVDLCTRKYSDEYILFVYDNQMQISKGTSVLDRKAIDFFSFDYIRKNMDYKKYAEYVKQIEKKIQSLNSTYIRHEIVNKEIQNSIYYSNNETECIYFGLDNMDTFKKQFNDSWIDTDVIFPLKREKFEGKEFWVPNKKEELLRMLYQDYKTYPNDFGVTTHGYWDDYKRDNCITVEFYLCDAFEIAHFLPLYLAFRENGIWAIFVAEPQNINTSKTWFDFDKAVEILNSLQIEYKENCNPNANYAFTTQDAWILKKYKTSKKVNLSYGVGLNRANYSISERTVSGFDLRLVHGQFQKNMLQKYCSTSKIINIGFPKHFNSELKSQDLVKSELKIKTDKEIMVYFPTWDEDCSVEKFIHEIANLKNRFFIVTKLHHVLAREESKKNIRELIYANSDYVLDGNYSFEDAVALADFTICDAKSGAATEVVYLKPQIKLLLIAVREDINASFCDIINDLSIVINEPNKIYDAVETVDKNNCFEKRSEAIHKIYGDKAYDYMFDLIKMIQNYS